MKKMFTITFVLVVLTIFVSPASADLIPSDLELLGSYHSDGVYNLVGLNTWNGQPVSDTNKPTDFEAQLATTINFYSDKQNRNLLFVQVTDVITTNGSFWTGSAFQNVSLTGIQFSLAIDSNKPVGTPSFSSQYANVGQVLFTGNGSETVPLNDTPGYVMDDFGNQTYLIHTANGAEYAFGTWGFVNGATRIMGGGVFLLTFANNVHPDKDFDFPSSTVYSVYGIDNQFIQANFEGPPPKKVPEPDGLLLLAVGLAIVSVLRSRQRPVKK
jgi:hypothetical protein